MPTLGNTTLLEFLYVLAALYAIRYAFPNWRGALRHRKSLKEQGINGFNDQLAAKELRVQRYIFFAAISVLIIGVTLSLQESATGSPNPTLGGWEVAAFLIGTNLYLGHWSRNERDDGSRAMIKLASVMQQRLDSKDAAVAMERSENIKPKTKQVEKE